MRQNQYTECLYYFYDRVRCYMKVNYRKTWVGCYFGAAIQALAINVVPLFFATLHTQFSVSFEMLGRLVLINFLTQLTVDLLSLFFVDKWGYRTCYLLAHSTMAVGFVLFGTLPLVLPSPYVGMVIATVVYSIGSGLLEVLISPMADALPSDNKATALTMVHAFYPLGQVVTVIVTTAVLALCGREYWWLVILVWTLLPLTNLWRGLRMPFPEVEKVADNGGISGLFRSGQFWVALLMMLCAGASELAMSQWASLFAERALGISKVTGDLLGPCLFALFMGIGRFWYGRFGGHVPLRPVLLGSAVMCVGCYALSVLAPWSGVALLGCAFCGLSVSLMWPGTISYVAPRMAHGGTALFCCLALAGDAGCSLGPWLTGLISDAVQPYCTSGDPVQFGLRVGLMSAAIFPILMAILLAFFTGKAKEN